MIPAWLWLIGAVAVVVLVFLLARMPGNANVEGQAPPAEGPDVTGADRPDISAEDDRQTKP